ncbi:MAG: hypothetical protein WAT46_16260, partial [Saprospiraceae bacterium]
LEDLKVQQAATNMNWTSATAATFNGITVAITYTNMNATGIGPNAVSNGTYSCNPLDGGASQEGSVSSWGTGSNNPTPTATITFANPVLDPIIYVQAMDFRRFDLAGTLQTNCNPVSVVRRNVAMAVT